MRIIFMGTPGFAVPALRALVEAGHEVVACYTQPPRRAGRGKQVQPSPVQQAAEAFGIPVRYPPSLKGAEEQRAFAALDADAAVVAAYGLILPQPVLDAPVHGCLNIHASLLPRWRGAAPVQRAILAGDEETGVTIMRMERGLDTGPMLATRRVDVDRKNAGELTAELAAVGAALMVDVLGNLAALTPVPQPEEGVTYAHKIDKEESRLDFTVPALTVERQVRAFAPTPGAFFELEGERYRVLAADIVGRPRLDPEPLDRQPSVGIQAPAVPEQVRDDAGTTLDRHLTIACGTGAIRPTLVQRAGRPVMDTAALLRGRPIPAGTVLG